MTNTSIHAEKQTELELFLEEREQTQKNLFDTKLSKIEAENTGDDQWEAYVNFLSEESDTMMRNGLSFIHFAAYIGTGGKESLDYMDSKFFALKGKQLDKVDRHGATSLFYAIIGDAKKEMITYYVEGEGNVNHRDNWGNTALHLVAREFGLEGMTKESGLKIAKQLIQSGCYVDLPNEANETPLLIAAERKEITLVDYLLTQGATLNVTDHAGINVAGYLLNAGFADALDRFLKKNTVSKETKIEEKNEEKKEEEKSEIIEHHYQGGFLGHEVQDYDHNSTPIRLPYEEIFKAEGIVKHLVTTPDYFSSLKILIKYKKALGKTHPLFKEIMQVAIHHGEEDLIKLFLSEGIYYTNNFIDACANNQRIIAELLWKKGVCPYQEKAIYQAAYNGHTQLLRWLRNAIFTKDSATYTWEVTASEKAKIAIDFKGSVLRGLQKQVEFNKLTSSSSILDLAEYAFLDKEMETFLELLGRDTTIRKLKLSRNNLSVKAGKALGRTLMISKTLQEADLSHNCFGGGSRFFDSGAEKIVKSLEKNTTLIKLNLTKNKLNDTDIKTLVKVLKTNQTLQHLDLSDNEMTNSAMDELIKVVTDHPSLIEINVDGNRGITPWDSKRLQKKLAENKARIEEQKRHKQQQQPAEEQSKKIEEEQLNYTPPKDVQIDADAKVKVFNDTLSEKDIVAPNEEEKAQKIQAIKQKRVEIENEKSQLEEILQQNQQDSDMSRDISLKIADLESRLTALEEFQSAIEALHELEQGRFDAYRKFGKEERLWAFYRVVTIELEAYFHVCETLGTRAVNPDPKNLAFRSLQVIPVVSRLLSLLPPLANIAEDITRVLDALPIIYEIRESHVCKDISRLASAAEYQAAAELTARKLTDSFQEQIQSLKTLHQAHEMAEEAEKRSFGEKILGAFKKGVSDILEVVLKIPPKTAAEVMALYAVARMINSLHSGDVKLFETPTELEQRMLSPEAVTPVYVAKDLSEQLFGAVTNPSAAKGYLQKFFASLGTNLLALPNGNHWHVDEIFWKSGITVEGVKYAKADITDTKLYGFRQGTLREVTLWRYERVEDVARHENTASIPSSINNNNHTAQPKPEHKLSGPSSLPRYQGLTESCKHRSIDEEKGTKITDATINRIAGKAAVIVKEQHENLKKENEKLKKELLVVKGKTEILEATLEEKIAQQTKEFKEKTEALEEKIAQLEKLISINQLSHHSAVNQPPQPSSSIRSTDNLSSSGSTPQHGANPNIMLPAQKRN